MMMMMMTYVRRYRNYCADQTGKGPHVVLICKDGDDNGSVDVSDWQEWTLCMLGPYQYHYSQTALQ